MAVLNPRYRVVSVRLSEDEYRHLADLCVKRGAHSISDFARIAICNFLRRRNLDNDRNAFSEMAVEEKFAQLEEEVRRLSQMLDTKTLAAKG
jgi:hypothetical protein